MFMKARSLRQLVFFQFVVYLMDFASVVRTREIIPMPKSFSTKPIVVFASIDEFYDADDLKNSGAKVFCFSRSLDLLMSSRD